MKEFHVQIHDIKDGFTDHGTGQRPGNILDFCLTGDLKCTISAQMVVKQYHQKDHQTFVVAQYLKKDPDARKFDQP